MRYHFERCYVCEHLGDLSWTATWRPMVPRKVTSIKPGLEAWTDTIEGTWAVLCKQHLVDLRAKTAFDALKKGKME